MSVEVLDRDIIRDGGDGNLRRVTLIEDYRVPLGTRNEGHSSGVSERGTVVPTHGQTVSFTEVVWNYKVQVQVGTHVNDKKVDTGVEEYLKVSVSVYGHGNLYV